MGAMALLTAVGWPYAPAAAAAVELAVLNNFFWHERWTWRDRTLLRGRTARLVQLPHLQRAHVHRRKRRVHDASGRVGRHAPVLCANAAGGGAYGDGELPGGRSVGVCAAGGRGRAGAAHARCAGCAGRRAAAGNGRGVGVLRRDRRARSRAARCAVGEPVGETIGVPGGTIHHWRGATLVRGVTVDQLVQRADAPWHAAAAGGRARITRARSVGVDAACLHQAGAQRRRDRDLRHRAHDDVPARVEPC